ncbi:DUF1652 domain-containing protein [Pseudomonas petrae]|uniref:DUF1652 domain-containing protein n=1 Tax=Pseudomonas petrae TaxID=2912190 RepID=A0ABS9I2N9_9PSED|nr:DUF1652 domain-containing protein [Pseudomonas petrae]MCF7532523.1 DUF1652 domain-containing protein [Pseudomonas petrae]MCF7536232.1 DUF1652 domain-containing protein [Pseudomonas petrae]MCF7541619.1 DUF1652 domain-containing protein [Pseudomonas petrae]MCF7557463.1 DUF1652 domain-containing protein [Pseudomonas petrae]
MISPLELCHIVESGFLPAKCKCTIDAKDQMMVQIFDRERGHADLLAGGIPVSSLNSSRAIANLIARLKDDLKLHAAGRRATAHQERA